MHPELALCHPSQPARACPGALGHRQEVVDTTWGLLPQGISLLKPQPQPQPWVQTEEPWAPLSSWGSARPELGLPSLCFLSPCPPGTLVKQE